jgi:hypothetical protein
MAWLISKMLAEAYENSPYSRVPAAQQEPRGPQVHAELPPGVKKMERPRKRPNKDGDGLTELLGAWEEKKGKN